ncbi:hypothetical protein COU49_01075 [Candidatus Nomurabacteria bacterium CG10_big_fil_rev_8_21_14_0_10_35_16]|uniref:Peptidase S11 D-alanyl-D-alanine carboxypeptidase A N-terminal domain-containing protein n=1 Tax=Candidatus Nomurabacteria bacterium CG10_big_fil_rev_8_21_14_0_10_35_16 TaxID=1974731 RepID=A0A2H0TBN7_9BACT|nr:MAG: hypothetical protein COU49_01075 [Candidatus Nomurabacteria bacterium CG10_big_fil_rev_8_21_14_0_10_35_16]
MRDNHLKLTFLGVLFLLVLMGRINTEKNVATALEKKQNNISTNLVARPNLKSISKTTKVDPTFESVIALPRKNKNVINPNLEATAVYAKDLDTDYQLYYFNGNSRWPLASLTKLMTAVIAVEKIGVDKNIDISQSAVDTEAVAGGLKVGERYSVGELIKAMLVVSSNDAAVAIAEFYGQENFVSEMKSKAYELGMYQTTYDDPTGISSRNQGTVSDLEKLVKYIVKKHPALFKISAERSINIFEQTTSTERELLNINAYAQSRPYFLGGKTGFTDEAHGNLVTLFNYEGHKLLLIVMGTEDRFGQTDLLFNWIKKSFNF